MLAQGQEMGHFLYGGSTVITVFERGRVRYDSDLAEHSLRGVETLVRMGSSLGAAAP
jgi:phosphatidylserine decarboxylase